MVTDDVRALLAVLAPWLAAQQPFLLVGPEGCGKSTVLDYCFSRLPGRVTVATVHCSAQTSADTVIQKLLQVCGKPVTTNQGKCLRPDTGRVILYLKDINLPKPDKYQTMQVVAFAQQLLTHGGYYDQHLEFIRVERVQVVASMVPGSSAGRSTLSRRFTARMRLAVMGHPDAQQLEAVYTRMIQQAFGSSSQKQAAALTSQAASYARCMVQLYQQLQAAFGSSFGSSGGKVHCSFNPRHLTSWVQGLQRYDLSHVDVVEAVAAEGLSTFGGCLPDGAARQLQELLLAALKNGLGYRGGLPSGQLFSTLTASPEARLAAAAAGSAMPLSRLSADDAAELMAGVLRSFSREVADTPLLLVPQALQRVAALDRCLSAPAGAVLLVGPAGSGRRSLAQLVAHAHGMRWCSPRISRRFDAAAFRCELKEALRTAGVEGTPLLLYLEERHLADDPGVLELLNCLLSAGEVPGLYGPDELAKDMAALEAKRGADSHYQGPPSSYAYFLACLQRHLRIATSLDPTSEGFALQLEQNPALLNRCSLLAWQGWSDASLQAIAQGRLQARALGVDVLANLDCSESDSAALIALLLKLHSSAASQLGAAPRHFMAAADLYRATISSKREQLLQQQQFLKGGLDRLAEAAGTVDELSQQAEAQRTLLATKQGEADAALGNIQSSMEVAADRRREVEQLRQQLAEAESALQQRRGQVEAQLTDVQPLIDAARTAVGGIKADNINEVRSLRMAPDVIRDVLEGVLLLMGQEDTSWVAMKAFLGKRSVKEDIINYDAHRILATPGLQSKLDRLMAAKGASFEKEAAYRASQAAGPMAVWVSANLAYSDVLKQIAPLEKELTSLKNGLADSQARLQQCQEELQQLDDQVVRLKAEFQARIREAEALKLQLARAEGTVNAASDLLSKLSGERSRWAQQLAALDGQLAELPRAALAVAAFITYLPAHPEDVRERVMQDWTSLLGLPSFSLAAFMSSEAQQLTWQGQGLPSDALSAQNALAILHGVMTPLVIDPSSQAIEWLKAHIRAVGQTPEVLPLHDTHFQNSLELAVRFGKVLVVSEVDAVHPILHPLLRGDIKKQAGRLVVPVGDKLVDHNPNFKLYLVTRNASPQLTPDVLPLLTVTNFSITRSGLESQLLSLTLQHEQPELEARKAALLASETGLKLQQAGLEKQLLQALATSKGNLLEDAALLTSLNDTKTQASSVAAALRDGQALAAQLDAQRSAYRSLAGRGSLLYFTLVQLRQLDPMYCFSLNAFLKLFRQLLRWAAQAAGPASKANSGTGSSGSSNADALARNALLCDKLLELVHASVGRAVFNKDQLTLAVHVARSLLPEQFPAEEWAAFLSCSSGSSSGSVTAGARPGSAASTAAGAGSASASAGAVPSWIRDDRAAAYEQLAATLPHLVAAAQLHDARIWAPWAASTTGAGANGSSSSSAEFVPAAAAGRLTGLQQLILVAAFKPECLSAAAGKLVCQLLRLPALTPAPLSMRQLLDTQDSSSSREPVLFITTPGADPSQELAAFAESQVGRDRLHEVAMGQGQSEVALQLLRGMCQNLHLVVAWLPLLEKEVHSLPGHALHPGFRLLLTSEAHPRFPPTLLEGALKVVFEAPPGVKMNLHRTYTYWSTDFLAGHPNSTAAAAPAAASSSSSLSSTQQQQLAVPAELVPLRAQLLFLLAWFNAVVQERRSYVPFGWSTAYDFSVADLRAASDVVGRAAACSGPAGPDWQQLLGLLQVIYGGRVDTQQDTKALLAHLNSIFQPELLTAFPTAAAAVAHGQSPSGRRQQQQQQQRLPGLHAFVGPMPVSGSKQDWQAFIAALPDADAPELFGLPANIERAMAAANSRQLLAALRQMGAAQGAAGGFDRAAWLALLQPLVKLWEQLLALAPPALRQAVSGGGGSAAAAAGSTSSGVSQLGPVDSFVGLERAFGVALLQLVARTMAGVEAVLAGEALAAAVQAAASALLQGQVCAEWDAHWEGPSSPADYMRAAMRRAAALEGLTNLGQQPGGLLALAGASAHAALDLGQLFRPGAFLSALGQQAARNAAVPLGVLRLVSCWQGGRLPQRCPLAVHVGGLLLQGALFDGHCLSPAWQDSPLTTAAPVVTLAWLPPEAPPPYPRAMPVPLFFNSEGRARVVAELQLPVAGAAEQQQWTLAGGLKACSECPEDIKTRLSTAKASSDASKNAKRKREEEVDASVLF
ncbi:ATP-binding dynein motor region D5-domain-containing protein [Scenedesmus sp. NREL 46B-D3]|nr:ATP-binding dynein motor region D5-domain-containing protein [Scenedesmus sp. NREL 46B-D3]